ncbi:MAG: lamin tail domain-containing protein [Melioribacteraceae bacterium]|nr:lamin tail domain-containing protein [Melioribacteraceae bacterium]MCF8353141.1 lamin tail domain-containing protein [Melioribacteraceae bacterium]MCF8393159.1 lamin tail domain-containing protein [Melioribacteraceae bacterium]MCF8418062.1 lamin tail domain-containing protein [Melioribacteraceae bacterium]
MRRFVSLLFVNFILLCFMSSWIIAQPVINEINYNPVEAGTDSTEFIEFYNPGESAVDLSNYSTTGVTFTFPDGAVIAAGGYMVITVNASAFSDIYGYDADYEWTSGGLSNSGETLTLLDAGSATVNQVTYDDAAPWPTSPDGGGPTLELIDASTDNTLAENWQASYVAGGTPGLANSTQPDPTVYTVYQIQSEDHTGEFVQTTGIVTSVDNDADIFTIQDGTGEYSGVWVTGTTDVAEGDDVTIVGTVLETYDLTQIEAVTTTINSSGNELPVPEVLTTGAVSTEEWEGVLVSTSGVCDNPDLGFGEWSVDDGTGSVVMDDLYFVVTPEAGKVYYITGPLYYSFSVFKILPRSADDIDTEAAALLHLSFDGNTTGADGETPTVETNVTFEAGVFDQAAYFGADSELKYLVEGNYDNTKGSISFWTKLRDYGDAGLDRYFFAHGTSNGAEIFGIDGGNYLKGIFDLYDSAGFGEGIVSTNYTERVVKNSWYHLTITWELSGQAIIYVNGTARATADLDAGLGASADTEMFIGKALGNVCDAVIDEFTIYDKPLNVDEITALNEAFVRPAEVYVDDDGDPVAGDGTSGNPFVNIDQATATIANGGTIYVLPGTYTQTYDGMYKDATILSTDGWEQTIIDLENNRDTYNMGFRINGNVLTIDGFTFKNASPSFALFYSWNTEATFEISNCFIDTVFTGYVMHLNKLVDSKVHHNIFRAPHKHGVLAYGDTEVYNNTFVGIYNTDAGGPAQSIWAAGDGGSAANVIVRNNILVGSDHEQSTGLGQGGDVFLTASNNLFFGNSIDTTFSPAEGYTYTDEGGSLYGLDPMLTDPAAANFEIMDGSPAIDAGMDIGYTFNGLAPDMGALESPYTTALLEAWVEAGADSASADGSEAHPFPDIPTALEQMQDNGTVWVKPGTYAHGVISAPRPNFITIKSTDGPENTIIDGSLPGNPYGETFGILIRTSRGWKIDGFKFINIGATNPAYAGYACGIYFDDRIDGVGDSTVVSEVLNCVFVEPNYRGVWVQKSTTVLMHHNLFVGGGNAVLSYGNLIAHNNTITGMVEIVDSKGAGIIQTGDSGSGGELHAYNNIFYNNVYGFSRENDSYAYSSNNLYFGNTLGDTLEVNPVGDYVITDYGANVYDDPMFADTASMNYELTDGSPAVDAGIDLGYEYNGLAPDLGAFESPYTTALLTAYVEAGADSSLADGSEAHPFPDIPSALVMMQNGATVYVKPGTYAHAVISAPRPENITIESTDGPEETIIDGSLPGNPYGETFGILIRTGLGWKVKGFKFINIGATEPAYAGYACGVYFDNRVNGAYDSSYVGEVSNCIFVEPNYRGVWVQKYTHVVMHHNTFIGGGNAALSYGYLDAYNNTIVDMVEIIDSKGAGIIQTGDDGGTGTPSDGVLNSYNNIFANNVVGYSREQLSYAYASNNLYFENTVDTLSIPPDGDYSGYEIFDYGDNVFNDPLFVNSDSLDYRLYETSPAMNAGVDVGFPFIGTAPEIGSYEGDGVVGVNDDALPTVYKLEQNYPNPFNPTTTIRYAIPFDGLVELKVFNVLGQEVLTLVNQNQKPGFYDVQFNASKLASGVYIYSIKVNDFVSVKKMMLLK